MTRFVAFVIGAAFLTAGQAAFAATPWKLDPGHSKLTFTATQGGSAFTGQFKKFSADISFDPADLAGSKVVVTIDTNSAATGDDLRDEALPGDEWFAASDFPAARFESTGFTSTGADKYDVAGNLTIRDVSKAVVIPTTITVSGMNAHAMGGIAIDRSTFGVGQGAWKSDDQVGFNVQIAFDIVATR